MTEFFLYRKILHAIMVGVALVSLNAEAEALKEWSESIKSLCMAPDQPGKYWNVDSHASAGGEVRVKLVGKAEGNTGVTFSKGEWDGIQQVLKEQQADEHKNYRECVQNIIPMLKDKVSVVVDPAANVVKLLDLPLGTARNDVKQDGQWINENGKIYFKHSQRFMGFQFSAFTLFEKDRAISAILKFKNEYHDEYVASRRDRHGSNVTRGSVDVVSSYCYGDFYNKIVSNMIGKLGAPVSPADSQKEDKSGELNHIAGYCKYSSAICEKKWSQEIRISKFQIGSEVVELDARRNEGYRSASFGDNAISVASDECKWLVSISGV